MFLCIRNAHVYDPGDIGVKDVLICNDRIIEIGHDLSVPGKTKEIDGAGKTLLPGLIDGHVHMIGGGGEDGYASLIPELQITDCIRYGVTTVVGLLGTDSAVKSVRALVAKTKALKERGMSAYCLTGSYAYPSCTITGSVRDDITFIDEIIGVKIAISDHRSSNIQKEELARLATEVRYAALLSGKAGVVHMHTGRGKRGYQDVLEIIDETDIPVSHFRPTHVSNQLKDGILFAKKGGWLDFTAGEHTAKDIHEAVKEGVRLDQITLSSDANGSFPVWDENKNLIGMGIGRMETLLETVFDLTEKEGFSFSEAISLLTCNPARALKLKQKGRIEEGYDADLLLMNQENQLTDVIALGKEMMRDQTMITQNYYL